MHQQKSLLTYLNTSIMKTYKRSIKTNRTGKLQVSENYRLNRTQACTWATHTRTHFCYNKIRNESTSFIFRYLDWIENLSVTYLVTFKDALQNVRRKTSRNWLVHFVNLFRESLSSNIRLHRLTKRKANNVSTFHLNRSKNI